MHVVVGIVGKMVRRAFLVGDLLVFGSSCIFPFLHCFLPMGWLQQHIVIHIYVGCLFVCSPTLAFIIGTKAAILSSPFS